MSAAVCACHARHASKAKRAGLRLIYQRFYRKSRCATVFYSNFFGDDPKFFNHERHAELEIQAEGCIEKTFRPLNVYRFRVPFLSPKK
jgi:hypothetical protein